MGTIDLDSKTVIIKTGKAGGCEARSPKGLKA